jgi:hypothetical protein
VPVPQIGPCAGSRVETQFGFAMMGIRAVAAKATIGKEWSNLTIEFHPWRLVPVSAQCAGNGQQHRCREVPEHSIGPWQCEMHRDSNSRHE